MRVNPVHMKSIHKRLLDWYDLHGRKNLPWQWRGQAYPVWISEIMLQQTQVNTVIPYFQRFMKRFPDIKTLAGAPLDDVLHHWTGLGYYARARNLHKAAQCITAEHNGLFPANLEAVVALPGIGRSTAGAILAFAHGQRHPILDGNVKRVLTRLHAIPGWPGERSVELQLWDKADFHTPYERAADYTQAIMDLGATVCRRGKPDCPACPLRRSCLARKTGRAHEYPHRRPRKTLPEKTVVMPMVLNGDRVLLQQRPPSGIWGALWGFPECPREVDMPSWCRQHLGLTVTAAAAWPTVRHSFSHYRLLIVPVPAQLKRAQDRVMECPRAVWYNLNGPDDRGFPAPVKKLMDKLRKAL